MGEQPNKLLQEALTLSADERAALAAALIETLEVGSADADVEAAWAAEIERRIADIDAGVVKTIPWPEARAAIVRR
jgi:putative addiction module component (TIGR02574 family)